MFNAAYESEWELMPRDVKRSIGLIIMRAQQPVSVNAGLFGSLCLPTFGMVIIVVH